MLNLRNLTKLLLGLVIVLAVVIGLTSINHPIILKWITGSAKHHGKPMPATVYADGEINNHIKIFYADEADSYLVSLEEPDSPETLKIILINLNEKWIGRPTGTSENDFDFIAGHLFQSKTASHFSPFQDELKGFNFDPQLSHAGRQIKFRMPPDKLKFDSVRIILP